MLGNLCDARCVFQVSTDAAGRAVIRGRRASHAAMHGRSRRHFQLSDSPITHVDHSDYFSFSTVFRDLLDRISLKLTKKKKGHFVYSAIPDNVDIVNIKTVLLWHFLLSSVLFVFDEVDCGR